MFYLLFIKFQMTCKCVISPESSGRSPGPGRQREAGASRGEEKGLLLHKFHASGFLWINKSDEESYWWTPRTPSLTTVFVFLRRQVQFYPFFRGIFFSNIFKNIFSFQFVDKTILPIGVILAFTALSVPNESSLTFDFLFIMVVSNLVLLWKLFHF